MTYGMITVITCLRRASPVIEKHVICPMIVRRQVLSSYTTCLTRLGFVLGAWTPFSAPAVRTPAPCSCDPPLKQKHVIQTHLRTPTSTLCFVNEASRGGACALIASCRNRVCLWCVSVVCGVTWWLLLFTESCDARCLKVSKPKTCKTVFWRTPRELCLSMTVYGLMLAYIGVFGNAKQGVIIGLPCVKTSRKPNEICATQWQRMCWYSSQELWVGV